MPTTLFNPWHGYPSANVVYVDANYLRMRANGQLAYPSIELAVAAWRVGGQAQVLHGTPTAAKPGAVLIGVGSFAMAASVDFDVDFLHFIGVNKESSILVPAVGLTSPFHLVTANLFFENIWFNCDAGVAAGAVMRIETVTNENYFENCKISLGGGNFVVLFQSNAVAFNGTLVNCELVVDTTTAVYGLAIDGSSSGRFIDCLFNFSNDVIESRMSGGGTFTMQFIGCEFIGAPAHFLSINNGTFNGKVANCTFTNTAGRGIDNLSGTFTGIVDDCIFVCASNPINGISSVITNCYARATGSNVAAISNVVAGMVAARNRIIGTGTGVAIHGPGVTIEATGNQLRMPTGDVPGSSISAAITNSAATPFNSEIVAATTA